MRYFNNLTVDQINEVFFIQPNNFSRDSEIDLLSYAVGACLYIPSIRKDISSIFIEKKYPQLKSTVICLEDSIGDDMLIESEEILVETFNEIKRAISENRLEYEELPLIFIRIRTPEHLLNISKVLGENLDFVTGFAFPKFCKDTAYIYFENLKEINKYTSKKIYAMPILESKKLAYIETRREALLEIRDVLLNNRDLVLNIRIGGTDFSGYFGLRRNYDMCIYDLCLLNECISDILNFFARQEHNFIISGPVWEYFSSKRIFKPQIRQSPFEAYFGKDGAYIRKRILDKYLDGLIREVNMDKANGMIGKTVIHPSHILPVQSMYIVNKEEYSDALHILSNDENKNGALKSEFNNKMNEIKPHKYWAYKIIQRSKIYGVFNDDKDFMYLLERQQ